MPLYEYECAMCGERFELIQKFSDDPLKVHAEHAGSTCDGAVRKLLSAPAIQFKGSGWYVTDYGKGGAKPPAETGDTGSKAETKSSDSKDSSSAKSTKPPVTSGASASVSAAS